MRLAEAIQEMGINDVIDHPLWDSIAIDGVTLVEEVTRKPYGFTLMHFDHSYYDGLEEIGEWTIRGKSE